MREVGRLACHRACREIETEAELVENGELEAGQLGAQCKAVLAVIQRLNREAKQTVMRVALGQQPQMIAYELAGIEPSLVGDEVGGARIDHLDCHRAQMLFEPG